MIIRFFKSNQQATFIAIPLFVICLWIEGFIKHILPGIYAPMPIYKFIMQFYSSKTEIIYRIVALGLVVVQSIYLNNIINKHEVLYKRSHLPALIYCVLMSLFMPYLTLHPILILSTLLIRLLDNILSFYKSTTNLLSFDSGVLVGMCALIYFPSIILIVSVLISLIILRPFYWRNWMVALLGLGLPFYFVSVYYFCVDRLGKFWLRDIPSYFLHYFRFDFNFSRPMKLLAMMMGLVLLLSLLKLQVNFFKNAIRTRNYQIVLLFFLVICGVSLLLSPAIHLEDFTIMVLPASIFISYYFLSIRRALWAEGLMLFILFLIVYNQVVYR